MNASGARFSSRLTLDALNNKRTILDKKIALYLFLHSVLTARWRRGSSEGTNATRLFWKKEKEKKLSRESSTRSGPAARLKREKPRLITVVVVLQVVVRPWSSELGEVLLVVELQEVGSLSAETEKSRWQAARQGDQPLGAADRKRRGTDVLRHRFHLLTCL